MNIIKNLIPTIQYAALIAAGAFISALEADGFAQHFGTWAVVVTAVLGVFQSELGAAAKADKPA